MGKINTLEIPKWGLSMEEGTIAEWLIQEGQSFNKGDEVCEIETSKIVNVLEAPFSGTLRKIIAKEGDTLPVGGVIAVCADADVNDAEIEQFISSLGKGSEASSANVSMAESTPAEQKQSVVVETSPVVAESENTTVVTSKTLTTGNFVIPAELQGYQSNDAIFATPHAKKLAEQHNIDLSKITATGRAGRISVQDIQKTVQALGGRWADVNRANTAKKPTKSTADDSHLPATPVARRLAKQWGINLHDCRVSGTRGRICKEDVEAEYARQNPTVTTVVSSGSESPASTVIPLNAMRKAIASRLQSAKRNAPHFRLTIDLNVEALQALRTQINQSVPTVKLSINDMLIKAVATALMAVPEVNVQFDEEKQQIIQFAQADVSVAVAIDNGLITPIVKGANLKSLSEISNEMRDLATRAKTGRLQPDEFQGGSFSISNLGMLGIKQFDAIINPPQGAILAVGMSEQRAVVEQGELVIRSMTTVSLSCDHRVIDGALGAKFLAHLKQIVENPALMLI